jgi:hypothetical protein
VGEYTVRRLDDGTILHETFNIESALGFAYGWNHHNNRASAPVEVVDAVLLAAEQPATLSEDNPKGGESE